MTFCQAAAVLFCFSPHLVCFDVVGFVLLVFDCLDYRFLHGICLEPILLLLPIDV